MFKQFLKVVEGADFFLITSFLIFLVFFILVTIWLLKVDKSYIERAKQVPLNDTDTPIDNK